MYNRNMDGQNLEQNMEVPEVPSGVSSASDIPEVLGGEEKDKKGKKGLFAGVSVTILVAIMVSVGVTMWMQSNKSSEMDSGTTIADETGNETTNTELSSGTVTTTIGGKSVTYKAKYVVDGIKATIDGGTYESDSDDEVVFLVINGGELALENATVNKTGSADFLGRGDSYSFYGTNSAIVVVGEGSEVGLSNVTINTSVNGANAVVATNGGSVVFGEISIATSGDSSRGLHATYGGSIVGNGGTISTIGQSCASLATDRGTGTVKVSGMTLSTAGAGSPLIYSTGEISVSSSTGTATGAQIAVVEGKNSITVNDCYFSANGVGNRNNVDNAGVMIYQSMSGDADEGVGSFTAKDSTLEVLETSEVYTTTPFFFITNTEAEVSLSNVDLSFYEDGYFVMATGTEEWGKSDSNGGKVTFSVSGLTATNYKIGVDSISSVSGL